MRSDWSAISSSIAAVGPGGAAALVVFGLLVYLAPVMIAAGKRRTNLVAIGFVNVLLGWTVVGWIAALIWSLKPAAAALSHLREGLVTARGAGGRAVFTGREVIIDRTGAVSFLMHGLTGERSLAISAIRTVRLRPAGRNARGYLRFILLRSAGGHRGLVGAAADENCILFEASEQAAFERLATAIRAAVRQYRKPVVVSAPTDPGELAELAVLRRQGLIAADQSVEGPTLQRRLARTLARAATLAQQPVAELDDIGKSGAAAAHQAFVARWTLGGQGPEAQRQDARLPQNAEAMSDRRPD